MQPASVPRAPLSSVQRARGRRLAIASHPAGMTFRMVFTQHLPTLALVALGASELQVGLQGAFVYAFIALQLPALGVVGRVSKRRILVSAHVFAVTAATPLLLYASLAERGGESAIAVALASFGFTAAGICVGDTVWFPLLRAYVEADRVGRFFGTLRTGWHLALIGFFSLSQWWLSRHPGRFAPLFALGWGLGVARTALIARLPERSERTGARIRAREAFALVREPRIRAYLVGVAWCNGMRVAALPFAVVMMRRVLGLSDGQVLYTTVALFTGGLASLYLWGRVVDGVGAAPVLRATAVGQGVLVAALAGVAPEGAAMVPVMVAWFFGLSLLSSGFGVADTHLLFELTPPEAPARTLVLGAVVVGVASGAAPVLAGVALDALLPASGGPGALGVYRAFFAVLGGLMALSFLPLLGLGGPARAA
jgi:predicted MFS family arabinose efflux permease